MASDCYDLCFEAILRRKQLSFIYRDRRRDVCAHVLGQMKGKDMLLAYQFGGETSSTLPRDGEWRCFEVSEMHSIEARHGEWHTRSSHSQRHACVAEVDLDVNPDAPQRSWAKHRRKA